MSFRLERSGMEESFLFGFPLTFPQLVMQKIPPLASLGRNDKWGTFLHFPNISTLNPH